ncbi:hypothetical protein GQR58_026052 [Nymphon striatum]|nr:hypothetical protein GQR58_026052 [Nymphon striatum]
MLSLKVKQRGGHRASTTKVVDEVEKACASENTTVVMLKGKKTILEIKLNVLAELDKDILDLMVESEPAEFEQEVSQADIYCTKILNTITHIDEVIDSLNPSTDLNASIDSVNSFNQNSGVKLPKLSIKPFNEKFTYLKSLVEGPAANCIAGLPLTANNFEIAFDLLKNRFGKRSAQIQAHISHLLRIQPVLSENSWFLRKLLDSLEINVRGLESLDISGKTYSALLVPILLSRLPDSIKLQWAKIDNSEDSDVKDLLKFLQKKWNPKNLQKFATESSTSSEPVNIESPMNNDPSLHSHTYTAPTSTIVLQTALVKVMGQTARPARLLFDTASNRSYIQSSYAKAIDSQQKGVETLNNSVFGGDVIRSQRMRVIRIELCPELKDIKLADTVQGGEMSIDILIGMDIYWGLIKNRIISTSIVCCSNIALLNIDDAQTMWDLETIGIKGKESEVENPCFENFKSNISFDGNRYSVSLLWKGDTSHLMNNEEQAFKRLIYLENRLDRNLKLKNTYNDAIKQMEQNDFIEEIDMCTPKNNSNVFYLPHHPVIKTSSFTTKVRPVFDASAKGPNGVSLNDCLHSGTSLIPDLVAVLIRFRRWTVALCGDIEKAFLQINLDKSERDFHRFLWKQNNKIRHMRFKRVTFGVKCSPFLLNAVVKFHLQNQTPSDAVHELHDNLYVDDLLTGANSVEEAIDLYQQTTEIIAKAGMNLRQWASNSPEIIKSIQQCRKGNVCELNNNQTKILGLVWDCETDSFSFIISELLKDIECLVVTKRLVLSSIAKIFDPLGFITPYTIAAKILFQDICKRGSDWDEELPVKYKNIWEQWLNELKDLQHVRFPRKLLKTENFKKLADQKSLQLHVFADASEKAYGCALTRLELLAALLASRLIDYVKESLYLPSDCSSYYWSDSKIVLAWIQSSPSRWKTFVANRVTEIQERTNANSWLHCPGISNPADLLTRPQKSNKCLDPLWWTGPQWLSEDNSFWPTMPQLNIEYTQESEIRKSFDINLVTTVYPVPFMKIDNFSNYKKLLRVTAYVFRAISIMKKSKITGPITSSEYDQSEIFWLKQTQMEFYPDAYNQIKCNKPIQTPELLKLNPIWD